MAADIREWLEGLGFGEYADRFAENDVERDLLPELDEDDLEKLGVASLGHRKRLLKAIAVLDSGASTESDPAETEQKPDARRAGQVAERRQLTVMFCDLVGSTELSARLDPEDMREVMRRYQDAVAGIVARYEGHVAKFLGDGVLAFFSWPRAHEDQAARAARTGLAAVRAVANLTTDDGRALAARVGIATGRVVIGDIVGEAATEADAVAGETPNLAARLQGEASPGQVVIGANTRRLIGATIGSQWRARFAGMLSSIITLAIGRPCARAPMKRSLWRTSTASSSSRLPETSWRAGRGFEWERARRARRRSAKAWRPTALPAQSYSCHIS